MKFVKNAVAATFVAASCLGAVAIAQTAEQGDGVVVWQQPADGLEPPRLWDCERIVPEYRDWIEAENDPQDWKYVGQTYREASDERLYDWAEWLDWYEGTCPGAGWLDGAATSVTAGSPVAIGLVAQVTAVAVWAALSGADNDRSSRPTRNDSPG